MKVINRKTLTEMVLSIVLGLTCCCVVACGSSEEKKIKIEEAPPLIISNLKIFDITETSAKISWETDKPAQSSVLWDTRDSITDETKRVSNPDLNTKHSFEMTDLLPATLYYYWAASSTPEKSYKVFGPATFTTQAK